MNCQHETYRQESSRFLDLYYKSWVGDRLCDRSCVANANMIRASVDPVLHFRMC